MRFPILLAAVLCLVGAVSASAQMLQKFPTAELAIRTPDGAVHAFTVELATTPQQRAQGLMYRRELAADRGMLFLHRRSADHGMWMRNTYIPLDMLFIKADGRVVHIAERTVPQSRETISAGQRVRAVLELRGGTADRLGLEKGSTVLYEPFGTGREDAGG